MRLLITIFFLKMPLSLIVFFIVFLFNISIIIFFGIALPNDNTAFKYSTWSYCFANNFWSRCIAFKFGWYCVNYSLWQLSQWQKRGPEHVMILNSNKLWCNKACRRKQQSRSSYEISVDETAAFTVFSYKLQILFEGGFYSRAAFFDKIRQL